MDDVLVCAPDDSMLLQTLELVIKVLTSAAFQLQEVQRVPPWKYLGPEITALTVVPQKLEIDSDLKNLEDLHSLWGSLDWVRPHQSRSRPSTQFIEGGERAGSSLGTDPRGKSRNQKSTESFGCEGGSSSSAQAAFEIHCPGKAATLAWFDIPMD